MGAGRIDAVGTRVVVEHSIQDAFGTPKFEERRLRVILPEELAAEREYSISEEPNPLRDVQSITETTRSAGGPINYEIRTEGLGAIYQGGLGSAEDVCTLTNTDGGVRCNVLTDYVPTSQELVCNFIPAGFPAAGKLAIAYRLGGSVDNQLTPVLNIPYSSYSTVTNTFQLTVDPTEPIRVEDFVFMYGDGAGGTVDLTGVYTHMYLAGSHLNTVSTWTILRDIVAFRYYDSKTNTISETYDNQSTIVGAIEVVAGDEFWAGRLAADATIASSWIQLDDIDNEIRDWAIFHGGYDPLGGPGGAHGGTMWIGAESGIDFSDVDRINGRIIGIPTAGSNSIETDHPIWPERQVVASASVPEILLTVTDGALASYNAGLWYRVGEDGIDIDAIEALSANWTLNNNLYTEKIPLGSRARAALPEGRREVTGTVHVEFDSPVEYHRVLRGTRGRLEILGIDQLTDIANTGVRKRNDTIFPNIQYTGETPTTANDQLYEYDLNYQGLASEGGRLPSLLKIVVNSQPDPLAGG